MSGWFNSAFLSAIGSSWVPILLDAALKGAVILALAGIATLLMRRASAAARHFVWSVAVAGLLLLPALSIVLPGWGVLPQWAGLTSGTAALSASPAVLETRADPVATYAPFSPAGPVAESVVPSPDPASFSEPETSVTAVAQAQSPAPPTTPIKAEHIAGAAVRAESVHWVWALALAVWAVGALLAVGRWCLGAASLWRLRRATPRITDASWVGMVRRLSEELGLRQSVVLLRGEPGLMPMTWGIFRARLVLPEEATEWQAQQRRLVLLHELAHVKRRDYLTQLITHVARGVYWFNPLVWIASRRIVVERERACDDLVLATGWEPSDYAEQLLRVVSGLQAGASPASVAIAMARPSKLEGRFRAILDAKRSRRALTRLMTAFALIAAVCLVVPLGVIRPVAKAAGAGESGNKADEEAKDWGEAVEGLRVRWVKSGEPVVAGTRPEVSVEVENASPDPILWNCNSEITWAVSWPDKSVLRGGSYVNFRVRTGNGVRLATAQEVRREFGTGSPDLKGQDPMPGHYRLLPGCRLYLTTEYPRTLAEPGQAAIEAIVARRFPLPGVELPTKEGYMTCPPLILEVLPASEKADDSWGEAVEGVQVRLRADEAVWTFGEVPTFKVDVRNHGPNEVMVPSHEHHWDLELDGKWHSHGIDSFDAPAIRLRPNGAHEGIVIRQLGDWQGAVQLAAGRHTVRVRFMLHYAKDDKPVYSISNPVEITIARALPGSCFSVQDAVKFKGTFAFAAVCQALSEPTPVLGSFTGRSHTLARQQFKVLEALCGLSPQDRALELQYVYVDVSYARERAINKAERIIWIVRKLDEKDIWCGTKALPDTPENRKAVVEAVKAARGLTPGAGISGSGDKDAGKPGRPSGPVAGLSRSDVPPLAAQGSYVS